MPGTDLGSDTGTATINATARIMELFMSLLEKIYQAAMKKQDPEYKQKAAQYKEFKTEQNRKALVEKLDGMGGYVSLRTLKKSGEPTFAFNIKGLDPNKDISRFAELCKREGVVFSGAYKDREDGKIDYNVVVRTKDLEKMKAITDRMNDEKIIENIDTRIAEIWGKVDVTQQDVVDIAELQRQKEEIQRKYCAELNGKQAEVIFDNAVNDRNNKAMSPEEALNRITGREIDKDVSSIVADSQNPGNYIKCHSFQDTYDNKPYIKTEYEVYRDGNKVLTADDGRFDGRPKGYWEKTRSEIVAAAGLTADSKVFKFFTEAEYGRWAEYAKTQNEQELKTMKPGERTQTDYDNIISDLKEQLKERGCELGQNGVLMKEGKPVPTVFRDGMTAEEKADISECHTINSQISIYTQLKTAEAALTEAKAYKMVIDDNTPSFHRAEIEENFEKASDKVQELKGYETILMERRRDINAVQADQNVTRDREQGLFEKTGQEQEAPEQTAGRNENTPERAEGVEERNEKDDKTRSLEEWKAQIEQDRKEAPTSGSVTPEHEKGANATGREGQSQAHAKPQSHGDR